MNPKHVSFLLMVCWATPCLGVDAAPERKSSSDVQQPVARENTEPVEAQKAVEELWPLSSILQAAADNVSRRYNLNENQREVTREMFDTRVRGFLDRHRTEIWPLIRDLMYYQQTATLPDKEVAERLGPVAAKILKEAKEEILKANEEWGDILTKNQKRLHKYDLDEMSKTFDAMENNFAKWTSGTTDGGQIFPIPDKLENEPPRPPRPLDKTLPVAKNKFLIDGHFDLFVRDFIKRYELTPPQIETAQSILRELKRRAANYRKSNQKKLGELEKMMAGAKTIQERKAARAELTRETKPLKDYFAELETRLKQIPDQAQRERGDTKTKKKPSKRAAVSSARGKRAPTPDSKAEAAPAQENKKQ